MNLEDQVCSLELSKKLEELGVKQFGYFKWFIDEPSGYTFLVSPNSIVDPQKKYHERYQAFTSSELLEILLKGEPINELWRDGGPLINVCVIAEKKESSYYAALQLESFVKTLYFRRLTLSKNPSDALAKLLIHVIENKWMEFPA